ncbi:transposase [Lacticaseibacillus paracasei]|uniref:transposase n=2 Tax=Lactobacillaceae TaxID=33958 RepID=UPI002F26D21F
MNELTTEIIAALAQKQDLDEVFRHHLEIAINQLLQTELAEFLGYERYSYAGINTGNNRNGSYERSFDTKYGQLNLTIPRDRNGRFENHTLPAYGRHSDNLETTVIQLYTKEITTAEIAELIEKMYGAHYSKATVSNMTKAVNEQLQAFQQRCLVHVGRNLMNKVRVKDRKAVISDFKQVHRAANREAAELKLNEFANNWHHTYPKLIKDLLKMPNLLTFMDFPPAIRQSLYSTNLIENFNKHLKRTTHHKEQFPTEDSLDRFLVSHFNVYNEKSLKRIHRGFKGLQDTLEASFI